MSIVLKNAEKNFNGLSVLEGVTFSFGKGDKIAVIGENGTGKSTLLRLLAEEEDLTSGSRITDGYLRMAFVHQDFPVDLVGGKDKIVKEIITTRGGAALLRNTKSVLKDFKLTEHILELPISALSGGQQKILDLSMAFAEHTDYLFLDEPENHIDIFARQVLISLMKDYDGGIVFVSHDQDLINSVTNRIVEIDGGKVLSYKGSYEFYLEEKARQEEGRQRAWKSHEKKVNQLDQLIKRMHQWVKMNPDLGAQLSSRKTQLERLHQKAPPKPKKHKRVALSIEDAETASSKRMLLTDRLSITRGDRCLLKNVSVSLFSGDRVAFVGRNGTGKTSFMRAITGNLPYEGILRVGEKVRIGYFSQDATERLDMQMTPLQALEQIMSGQEHHLRSVLARYLIDVNHCTRPIGTLSGGQKTRLQFCLLFAAKHDLLLLDEPTNHLDPVTWNIVVQAINDYQGALVLISHDRVFIDQTVKKLWVIEDQQIKLFLGTLTEYLQEEM